MLSLDRVTYSSSLDAVRQQSLGTSAHVRYSDFFLVSFLSSGIDLRQVSVLLAQGKYLELVKMADFIKAIHRRNFCL